MAGNEKMDELFVDYLDGVLDEQGIQTVEAYLAEHPEAVLELEELKSTVALLSDLPELDPPADLLDNVMQATVSKATFWSRIIDLFTFKREAPWGAAAAAMAAMLVIVVVVAFPNLFTLNSMEPAAPSQIPVTTAMMEEKEAEPVVAKEIDDLKAKPDASVVQPAAKKANESAPVMAKAAKPKSITDKKVAAKSAVTADKTKHYKVLGTSGVESERTEVNDVIAKGDVTTIDALAGLSGAEATGGGSLRAGAALDGAVAADLEKVVDNRKKSQSAPATSATTAKSGKKSFFKAKRRASKMTAAKMGGGEKMAEEGRKEEKALPPAPPPPIMLVAPEMLKKSTPLDGMTYGATPVGAGRTRNMDRFDHDTGPALSEDEDELVDEEVALAKEAAVAKLPIINRFDGTISKIKKRTLAFAVNSGQWKNLWKSAAPGTPSMPTPKVNFKNSFVVGLFLGQKPTGGHKVTITRVTWDGEKILVRVRLAHPKTGQASVQILTQPYSLVVVKQPEGVKITKSTPIDFIYE